MKFQWVVKTHSKLTLGQITVTVGIRHIAVMQDFSWITLVFLGWADFAYRC